MKGQPLNIKGGVIFRMYSCQNAVFKGSLKYNEITFYEFIFHLLPSLIWRECVLCVFHSQRNACTVLYFSSFIILILIYGGCRRIIRKKHAFWQLR